MITQQRMWHVQGKSTQDWERETQTETGCSLCDGVY
jgi:hypothetical protein